MPDYRWPENPDNVVPPLTEQEAQASSDPSDRNAVNEAGQLSSGLTEKELKSRALNAEADRTEGFKDHFEWIAVITLYIVWVLFLGCAVVWFYHLVMPKDWLFLETERTKILQNILTAGALAGLAGGHVKKRLN